MANRDWNISKLQVLRQCHRKFYFAYELASRSFADPFRRKAHELSKMKNLKMWQGTIVDWMITNEILPYYQEREVPDYAAIAKKGADMAKKQFEFSANRFYHDPEISKTESGTDYAILDVHESNTPYTEAELQGVYQTIEGILLAFPNFQSPVPGRNMEQYLLSARFLRPDAKTLKYEYEGIKIQPQIDLISYMGKSMHVIDWKVVEKADADYSRQLLLGGIVALHFSRERYKKEQWKPLPALEDVRLFEFNLLNGKFKEHVINKDSAANALDGVFLLSDEQEELSQSRPWDELDIEDYERTDKAATCAICNFRFLCKQIILNDLNYDEGQYTQLVQHQQLQPVTV